MARVLVIDDSEPVFVHVRKVLKADGHVVDRLSTFTELPSYMRNTPPALVLLDLEMPALSGAAFARFIRSVEPVPTPIIVHSSLDAATLKRAANEIGAVAIAPKGIAAAELLRIVRGVLPADELDRVQR